MVKEAENLLSITIQAHKRLSRIARKCVIGHVWPAKLRSASALSLIRAFCAALVGFCEPLVSREEKPVAPIMLNEYI